MHVLKYVERFNVFRELDGEELVEEPLSLTTLLPNVNTIALNVSPTSNVTGADAGDKGFLGFILNFFHVC